MNSARKLLPSGENTISVWILVVAKCAFTPAQSPAPAPTSNLLHLAPCPSPLLQASCLSTQPCTHCPPAPKPNLLLHAPAPGLYHLFSAPVPNPLPTVTALAPCHATQSIYCPLLQPPATQSFTAQPLPPPAPCSRSWETAWSYD